jgi:hypothetical protein
MKFSTDRLDADSFSYLKAVEAAKGRGFHGVFVRRSAGWFEGPRAGWWLALLAGVALLALAAVLSLPMFLEKVDLKKPAYVQGGFVAVAAALVLTGVVRFRRKTDHVFTRSFLFADALHLWDVRPDILEAIELTDLDGLDGKHRYVNGRYDGSTVKLFFPSGSRTVWVVGQRTTEGLLGFLQVLAGLRRSADPTLQRIATSSPEFFGAAAVRLARDGNNADLSNIDPGVTLPTPRDDPRGAPASAGWAGVAGRWAAGAAVGAAAAFGLPVLNRQVMEEEYYARIPVNDTGDLSALEKYLALYPTGSHADEVRQALDDRWFARAAREARQSDSATRLKAYLADAANIRHRKDAEHALEELDDRLFDKIKDKDRIGLQAVDAYRASFPAGKHIGQLAEARDHRMFADAGRAAEQDDNPGPARAYLADTANIRHRDEAKKLVGKCYDAAIANLKIRAQGTEAKVDPDLFAAIIAMLDTLRNAPTPVVPVGFKATIDAEPKTAAQKALQKAQIDARLVEKPELKAVAARQPDGTPILSRGAVFDPEQIQRRERVILERLSAAVQKGVKDEILTLRAAEPGQVPVLEVAYHIAAQGNLYLYTVTESQAPGMPVAQNVKGLLRGYNVDWTITVRPPGADKTHVCKLGSVPASSLNYDSAPGDPDWAPYAIILYSGFYDLSARLIQNFALNPGPAPNAFSFNAVASNKPDPAPPFNPGAGLPVAPPQPGFPKVPQPGFPKMPKPGGFPFKPR